jgi:acetate kinase
MRVFDAMVSTAFHTSPSFITSERNSPNEPSSRISTTEQVSALFIIANPLTPPWGSSPPVESLWGHAPEISILGLCLSSSHGALGADEMEDLINHQSGLFALSSGESDVKSLEDRARAKDPQAMLALNVFVISVRKAIGAYVALLGGVDILVFTGGIGEHSDYVRSAVTNDLEFLGLTADKIKGVPTEEEQQIARHCRRMIGQPQ